MSTNPSSRRRGSLVGLSCALLLGLLSACPQTPPAVPDAALRVQTEKAATEELANRILTTAQVEARDWHPLYFGHPGRVMRVYATENQPVKRGQLLAEQDTGVQLNQVQKSELQVKRARMEEEQTCHDFENTKSLLESGGVSQENVSDQEQRCLEAKLQREQVELSLEREVLQLEQMRLRAPFDGVITDVNIRDGDLVIGPVSDPDRDFNARPPMVVTNPDSIRTIRAQIPEGRTSGVRVGTPAEVTLVEHRDVVLNASVIRVSDTVDRDMRTVGVQLEVARPQTGYPEQLRDGSAALVALLTNQRQNAVTVTEHALYYYQNQAYVFVVGADGKVERRPVTLGLLRSGRVEITEGLAAGERVARSKLYMLRDGETVTTEENQ